MSRRIDPNDIAELEALAEKMERETQVYLGFRNAERAAVLRRVLDVLRAHTRSA